MNNRYASQTRKTSNPKRRLFGNVSHKSQKREVA